MPDEADEPDFVIKTLPKKRAYNKSYFARWYADPENRARKLAQNRAAAKRHRLKARSNPGKNGGDQVNALAQQAGPVERT